MSLHVSRNGRLIARALLAVLLVGVLHWSAAVAETVDLGFGPVIVTEVPESFLAPVSEVEPVIAADPLEMPLVTGPFRTASMLQQTRPAQIQPNIDRISIAPSPLRTGVGRRGAGAPAGAALNLSRYRLRRDYDSGVSLSSRSRSDATLARVATDLGSGIRNARLSVTASTQSRTPNVTGTRLGDSHNSKQPGSGFHWIPARIDLDTSLSKIDSHLVDNVLLIPGPYSTLYGPGFRFLDFELIPSPRYEDGREFHGLSGVTYSHNGDQLSGLQSFWTGDEHSGLRFDYSYRGANDYASGDGDRIASGYQSQTFNLKAGRDFRDGRSLEFALLRLDQSDVEFPGYAFDMDFLVTDAYEIEYIDRNGTLYDQMETEVWYNRTRFEGNAQNPSKRLQFPVLGPEVINYVGTTDVDSLSTGYRSAFQWGGQGDPIRLTVGHDMRFVKQELNEIGSGQKLGFPPPTYANQNSPIPRSFSVNPGLFLEFEETLCCHWIFRSGARIDFVQTDIVDDPAKLQDIGPDGLSYSGIVGTEEFQQEFLLWSLYAGAEHRFSKRLSGTLNLGYAERPPNLTELYAAEPFLLLLQNGVNDVTGDPRLRKEKLIQFDVTLDYQSDRFRAALRGFTGWSFDYVTLENTEVIRTDVGAGIAEDVQVSLRYVNTALATLAGFDALMELNPQSNLTPFVTARYLDGRDRTRNGDFATTEARPGPPMNPEIESDRDYGQPRGNESGIAGSDSEPLPGIAPLETRVGVRLRSSPTAPRWQIDLLARIVDNQDRVATSLLERATAGFTIWDIRGTYRPTGFPGVTLISGVENFTDKQYLEHLDYRPDLTGQAAFKPGISFYVGADASY